jgi:hypothetical protein
MKIVDKKIPVYSIGNPSLAGGFSGSRFTNIYAKKTSQTEAKEKVTKVTGKMMKAKKEKTDGDEPVST